MARKKTLMIRAVIFDMDGVITNTMPDHYKAWHMTLQELGINVSKFDIYSREGQKGTQSIKELLPLYGHKFSKPIAERFLKRKEELFKKISRKRFISGSRTFIRNLARDGFTLALVTGTSRHELHRILPPDIFELFSVVVTGTDVRIGKPHPEPYLKALKQLKTHPDHSIVIENAPFGIRSAKSAGIRCIALETSLPEEHLSEADHIFTSFADMRSKVRFALHDKKDT